MFVRPKFLVDTSTVTWRAWPPGAGPCGSKRRHPCRLRFRSSTSLTPMTHFVFHPQQNPFASPPSRQRKMCCFCHPVGRSLFLSPAEVDDSGSRDGRHSPRANIPREGAGRERDGKTGFCRGRSRAHTLLSFFFSLRTRPCRRFKAAMRPSCAAASRRFSQPALLPLTCTQKPEKLACKMPTGLHRCHDPLDMTARHDCASIRLASLSCPITLSRPATEGWMEKRQKCVIPHTRIPGF